MLAMYERITFIFDPLHDFWENDRTQRRVGVALVVVFLAGLLTIELKRRGLMPSPLHALTPSNHFYAVNLAFTLVLILEVISLIFTLPCSFSRSVGKQFEILALILLRDSFKELSVFPEPITVAGNLEPVMLIVGYAFGSLLIFALLGVYYRLQPSRKQEMALPHDLYHFVAAKKGIALIILGTFIVMGLTAFVQTVLGLPHVDFFPVFYTLLIFTDILMVLVAQCFQPSFHAVYRNSGYVVSTLLIRLALSAPGYYAIALGIVAVLFAIFLTLACTQIFQPKSKNR